MKTLTGPSVIANLVTVPILSISTKRLVGLDADISSLSLTLLKVHGYQCTITLRTVDGSYYTLLQAEKGAKQRI